MLGGLEGLDGVVGLGLGDLGGVLVEGVVGDLGGVLVEGVVGDLGGLPCGACELWWSLPTW